LPPENADMVEAPEKRRYLSQQLVKERMKLF
jgi:hypothetical protein